MKKINNYTVVSIFGLLFLLVGYVYLIYNLNSINMDIQSKKVELNDLESKIQLFQEKLIIKDKTIIGIEEKVKESNNKELISEVKKEVANAKSEENGIVSKYQNLTNDNPIVYIQVNNENVLEEMKKINLVEDLNNDGYTAFGYDIEKGRADNTIRYFHKEDFELADSINNLLKSKYSLDTKSILVNGYETSVPMRQVELWVK